MKKAKARVPILLWAGIAILVVGVVIGIVWDIDELQVNQYTVQSLALLFGQVATPIWEGLVLIAGSVIVDRLSRDS